MPTLAAVFLFHAVCVGGHGCLSERMMMRRWDTCSAELTTKIPPPPPNHTCCVGVTRGENMMEATKVAWGVFSIIQTERWIGTCLWIILAWIGVKMSRFSTIYKPQWMNLWIIQCPADTKSQCGKPTEGRIQKQASIIDIPLISLHLFHLWYFGPLVSLVQSVI